MRGLPNPLIPEELEGSPDSPIITHSYYVTYEFAKGEKKGEKAASKVGVELFSHLLFLNYIGVPD